MPHSGYRGLQVLEGTSFSRWKAFLGMTNQEFCLHTRTLIVNFLVKAWITKDEDIHTVKKNYTEIHFCLVNQGSLTGLINCAHCLLFIHLFFLAFQKPLVVLLSRSFAMHTAYIHIPLRHWVSQCNKVGAFLWQGKDEFYLTYLGNKMPSWRG